MLAWGANGAGKTNLLEALHVATQGLSPRTRNDGNLVRFGAVGYRVSAAGTGDRGSVTIDVRWHSGEGKRARVNGAPVDSLERLRVDTATLVFTPDRLAVVKAGPSVRRSYIDRVIARLFPARASASTDCSAVLVQRNAALRRVAAGQSPSETIAPWDDRFVAASAELAAARAAVVSALAPGVAERAGELGVEDFRLEYEPNEVTGATLDARLDRDLERGSTGVGPHLDEIRMLASGRDLRAHGSQGEQRVAVLSLLLAERDLLADARRVPPLVLLDDVLSELDGTRREALVARLRQGGQVLVTAAARGALPGEADQVIEVTAGEARER